MKKRITALALAIVMVMGTVALAAGTEKNITISPMSLKINGQTVTPTKSNGEAAEVFAYDGATYAPVRYLAELLGIQVDWDANDSSSARLNVPGASVGVPQPFDKQLDTDVVVVGGGGAGMAAAIAAGQAGKSVILIEKVGYLGGATMISGGLIPAVGTKQQVEAGIDDNLEWFVRDIMRPSNYSVRKDLVYSVAENAKPTIEWLEELGAKFSVVTSSLYYGQSNYRMHLAEGSGKGLSAAMVAYLEEMGNVKVLFNTPGTGLATNEKGEVIGVYAENKEDGKLFISAKNTVLATSGFAANKEMIEEYIPEMKYAYPLVAPGATGEGILWGQELGAAVANMGAYQGHAFYNEEFGGSMEQAIANRGGIFINTNGVRFVNEYGGYSELSPHVLAQPGHHAYMVFNQAIADQSANFKKYQEAGIVYSGKTAEELAKDIGLPVEAVAKTIADYKVSIEKGEDELNRTKLPAHFDGPYYAVKITGDLRHTQGGLVIDTAAHVLTTEGKVIPGLYAAGGVTEGFSSTGGAAYMSGNGLLQAVVLGKIAGEKAATEVRGTVTAVEWVDPTETAVPDNKEENSSGVTAAVADGKYTGEGKGNNGAIKVQVTVSGGKITAVEVLEHAETEAIYNSAKDTVINGIVTANGTSGVDSVTGATRSSEGIKAAVEAALSSAKK